MSTGKCARCGQATRNFWRTEEGGYGAWCAFCVTVQVASAVGSSRFILFLDTFAHSIHSGEPEGLRSASLSLRAVAALGRRPASEPGAPSDP